MRSLTFAAGPCSARRRIRAPELSGDTTPPQSTRCSGRGISALLKLGPDPPEGDRREPADGVRRQPTALVDGLAVPAAGELLDDPGRLAAVPRERIVEAGARRVVRE